MSIPANHIVRHDPAPAAASLRVDGARMLRRLDELSRFGALPGPGITRTGLSAEENAGRRYLAERCHRDGLTTSTDQAGNLIIRRRGESPGKRVVLFGSHLDTVAHGGRLDGAYGVIAAHEVLRVIAEHAVALPFEPVAVAFSNEEGAYFPYPFLGSLALSGQVDVAGADTMTARDGRPLRAALREAGGDLDTIADAAWPPGSIASYVELHIEQGPVLEARQIPIGVVEAITGRTILDITVLGRQGHAGTTPMSLRRDALVVAAKMVLAVERLASGRNLCAVGTVGNLSVDPDVTNVIPGAVRMTAEIRDGRVDRLRDAERALVAELSLIAKTTDTAVEVDVRRVTRPTPTDDRIRRAITDAADGLGLANLTMFSGAGHDAQILAELAPIGMIFVPSRGGISHAPQEDTADTHLVDGANTLLHTVLRLAADDPCPTTEREEQS